MIVPPGSLASAAASTFSAVVPVSSVSPGPWLRLAGLTAEDGAAAVTAGVVVVLEPLVAAPAMPAAPTARPSVAASVAARRRVREVRAMVVLLSVRVRLGGE